MMTQYNDITRFFTILILILLISCQSSTIERQRTGNERFKTTAPSLIYFKNIKSIKYQNNRNPKTSLDFYQPKVFIEKSNLPIIYPVIVHNWLEDESYLVFERKNISKEAKILVEAVSGEFTALKWPSKDYLDQLEFVKELENIIKSGRNIFIEEPKEEKKALIYSISARISFSSTLQDFLKLTETADSRSKR